MSPPPARCSSPNDAAAPLRLEPIVVTGGLGFIGGYVTRALVELGREVVVVTRGHPATPDMQFALRDHAGAYATETVSVENLSQLVEVFGRLRPTTVVHAASNVDVADLYRDPFLAFKTNLAGTVNVFEAARRTGVGRGID